jgi:hypothetical protein
MVSADSPKRELSKAQAYLRGLEIQLVADLIIGYSTLLTGDSSARHRDIEFAVCMERIRHATKVNDPNAALEYPTSFDAAFKELEAARITIGSGNSDTAAYLQLAGVTGKSADAVTFATVKTGLATAPNVSTAPKRYDMCFGTKEVIMDGILAGTPMNQLFPVRCPHGSHCRYDHDEAKLREFGERKVKLLHKQQRVTNETSKYLPSLTPSIIPHNAIILDDGANTHGVNPSQLVPDSLTPIPIEEHATAAGWIQVTHIATMRTTGIAGSYYPDSPFSIISESSIRSDSEWELRSNPDGTSKTIRHRPSARAFTFHLSTTVFTSTSLQASHVSLSRRYTPSNSPQTSVIST